MKTIGKYEVKGIALSSRKCTSLIWIKSAVEKTSCTLEKSLGATRPNNGPCLVPFPGKMHSRLNGREDHEHFNIEKLIGAENKSRKVQKISSIEAYFSNKLNNKNCLYIT